MREIVEFNFNNNPNSSTNIEAVHDQVLNTLNPP